MAGTNAAYDLSMFERTYSYNDRSRTAARKRTTSARTAVRGASAAGRSEEEIREEKERARIAKEKKAAHDKKVTTVVVTVMSIALLVSLSMMAVLGGRLHDYKSTIDKKTAALEDLDNNYEGLRIEYEYILGTPAIEEYAINSIGMQKMQSSQIYWVTVDRGDLFEISDSGKKLFDMRAYVPFGIRAV